VTHRPPFARSRFLLERLVIRGLKFRLLLAAMVIVGVAIIAGLVVSAFGGDFANPADAVWWAFLRLTDPGYLGDDEGVARRSVSTVLTVLGFMLFVGMLIAILTQWLNQTIEKLESGVTPVVLSDHVIILGWTTQTRAIAESLLRAGSRAKRFLARRGAKDLRIVIMAEEVDDALRQRLIERLGPKTLGRQVLLRAGTPLRVDHLERVAFRDAAVVILPGSGFAEKNPERVDSMNIKTLASISTYSKSAGEAAAPPFVVAELFDARRVEVANNAYDGASEMIAADGIVSRLIAQSVRHRGLWSVLSELFMLHEGNSIYLRRVDGQAGARFGEFGDRFSKAVLCGLVRPAEKQPMLNPDAGTVIEADDLLVFLAREFDDCVPGPGEPTAVPVKATGEHPVRDPGDRTHRVLVLGWSRKVPALVRELGRFGGDAFEVDIASSTSIDVREAGMSELVSSEPGATVRQIEAGFATPGVLESLEPENYDNIVVLASEMLEEKEHADAISVVAALTLRNLVSGRNRNPDVLVELLDQENLQLFAGGDEDVMVSPMLVSYMISQVALRQELAWVFWELTRPWGGQILLRNARAYLSAEGPVRFGDLQRAAAARGEIALGFRRPGGDDAGLALNPDRNAEWSVGPADEVVTLTSIKDPDAE
jgi:hypothetical protein